MTANGSIVSTLIFMFALLELVNSDCLFDRGRANHEEAKLYSALLDDYFRMYSPRKGHKRSINVSVTFALKYITFDSLEETIILHSWMSLSWTDEFLKWTPADYGDIKEISVESNRIWTPKMSLFNADISIHQWDRIYTTCSVFNDGHVICVPQTAHRGICKTSLRRWPYDSQNCTLYFGSRMYIGEQVNFTFHHSQPVILDDYQNGPGWQLLNVLNDRITNPYGCCFNRTNSMLRYTFTLRREAAGPAAVVVAPSVVIITLTLTSLLLGIKDNKRLLLACFSLFGHFTFLIEIGDNIPKNSPDTPILLLFVRDSMIMTLVAILITMILTAISRKRDKVPMWIVTGNRLVSNGPIKYIVFTEFGLSNTADKQVMEESDNDTSCDVSHWIKFANTLNSCMFIISCIVYIVLITSHISFDD